MPFSDIAGHDRSLGLLSRSIARGSLPPSLLFTGPDGVGKRLAARATAQALNCLQVRRDREPGASDLFLAAGVRRTGLVLDACGVCPVCSRIGRGIHPDVLLIEPPDTGAIKIEPIREAIATTAFRPFEGRRRVIIVDEAERVLTDGQDALLKSLEEPPASSVFVLVTSRPEMLLATVRSRCSRLRFGRLSSAEVARLLVERHGFDEEEAHAAAAVAAGSLGRAIASGSRAFRNARNAAVGALQAVAAARTARERLAAATTLLSGKSTPAGERDELGTRIRMVASLVRDIAFTANGGPAAGLANGDLAGDLAALAGTMGADRAMQAFEAADRAAAALARNANSKIVADWLAIHL